MITTHVDTAAEALRAGLHQTHSPEGRLSVPEVYSVLLSARDVTWRLSEVLGFANTQLDTRIRAGGLGHDEDADPIMATRIGMVRVEQAHTDLAQVGRELEMAINALSPIRDTPTTGVVVS